MRVDELDNTLICEPNDLQEILLNVKEDRAMPAHIEKAILRIALEAILGHEVTLDTVDNYLQLFPGDFMQKVVNELNCMYVSPREKIDYRGKHVSYLLYYLPVNIYKVWKPVLDLLIGNALKPRLSILDVGTGPGSIPLGIIEFYTLLAKICPDISFCLSFTLLDAEQDFLTLASKLIGEVSLFLPPNLYVSIERKICHKIEAYSPSSAHRCYDLITMSNFLNKHEGDNQKYAISIINKLYDILQQDGSIVIIEPGEEASCIALKKIRNQILAQSRLQIYTPCSGVWDIKNELNCVCFNMVRSYWELPKMIRFLVDNGLSKANRKNIPFNYVVFRKDGLKKYRIQRNKQHYVSLQDLPSRIGATVNVIAQIRSVLEAEREITLLLCDGSCSFDEKVREVSVRIPKSCLEESGQHIRPISAERIILRKVVVRTRGRNIQLELSKESGFKIYY